MFDCHTHTNFSTDSKFEMEKSCETAISVGLEGITFTDHLDIDYPGFEEEFQIDFKVYSQKIDSLKSTYKNKLKILKGVEIGMQPHVLSDTYEKIKGLNFDLIIGSVHIVDGIDPYYDSYFEHRDKYKAHNDYLLEIYKNLKLYNDFDVLGHIDYVKRYGDFEDKTLLYKDHTDIIDAILKTLINSGKGLEINVGGFRYKLSSPLPDIDIYKRYKELGGEILTLGSDAHSEEYLGKFLNEAVDFAKEAGFRHSAYFENRKPILVNLN